ncbi:MAG: TonB-dependent receptor, partial [Bacteroidaceae bacterium]|nr:TonB-dependent receptor [Bacteroidaceae bacterium]
MKLLLIFAFHFSFFTLSAQSEKSVQLDEVKINSARVVEKPDRKIFFPTSQQLESSTSGFSLLSKLSLPYLTVNEVAMTITAPATMGGVQLRINDVVASTNDLLSLDLQAVQRVEYIDRPGLRYGEDLGFVVNIITRRAESGYVLGTRIAQSITSLINNDMVYGKYNVGKSEWSIDYNLAYSNLKGTRNEEQTDYRLADGSIYHVQRRDLSHHTQQLGQNLQLRYNLSDSLRVFQTTLRGKLSDVKKSRIHREISTPEGLSYADINSPDKSASPALDIYYFRHLAPRQSLTFNAVGTYIGSDYDYSYNDYAFHTDGSAYSLQTEALYENHLKPFNLSAGLQWNQKYTDNRYTGSAVAQTGI